MSNIKESLQALVEMDGAKAASLVDSESGMVLGEVGSGLDMELAAAGNSQVVKAKLDTIKSLQLNEELVDIMITLETQYHLIRPIKSQKGLFFYLVLDIAKSNLALARRKVQNVEAGLEV